MSPTYVFEQPPRRPAMSLDEKNDHYHHHTTSCSHVSSTLRQITPMLLAFSLLCAALLALLSLDASMDGSTLGVGGMLKRALGDGPNSDNGNGNNTFVDNKLYIIVIVLGLVLCLILSICLAAWCCRGSFRNPLCCPCYTCAACGGLACLECISCGLCADLAQTY